MHSLGRVCTVFNRGSDEEDAMTDLVTYRVPDEHGHTLIHQESSIVPGVGDEVTVHIEYNDCIHFEVVGIRYRLNNHDAENKTQAILELEELQ